MKAAHQNRLHVQFAISGHGFGHLGQCAPIINRLTEHHPEIKISVRSEVPQFKLREKLGDHVTLQFAQLDIGMIQQDALSIDHEKSYQAYHRLHQDWPQRVQQEADNLAGQGIDLIVANAPYLSLAAAKLAGIPCIAFCSLNWEEIFGYYFGEKNPAILDQIASAYRCADFFICPAPSMSMPAIANRIDTGPVAQEQTSTEVFPIELDDTDKLILISWGGMELTLNVDRWPKAETIHFIVPDEQETMGRSNIHTLKQLGISYQQALQRCDLLIAKPGYCTFVEAAILAKPIAYLPRIDWPEMSILVDWYQNIAKCTGISPIDVVNGGFISQLDVLLQQASADKIKACGNTEATTLILQHLQTIKNQ